jgi:hypothetical protein
VGQPLRRDLAQALAAAAARVVAQLDAPALEQRAADRFEEARVDRPARGGDDVHALHQLGGGHVAGAEHGVQPVQQRLQVAAEHALGLQAPDQLVHGQQRVDLPVAEPQAGQLAGALAAVVAETVGVVQAVVDDRRIQPLAQVLQVALQRRAGHLQLGAQGLETDAPAVADQQLDLVEAFGAVHAADLKCRPIHRLTP